jgi:23S rRNA (cytidine1920-2'-O)/16S rRNA (cytidine1409-2'-O)-methyltransferase
MPPLRKLIKELARLRPDLKDPEATIRGGAVLVDGVAVRNPASMVRPGTSIVVREERTLRGLRKLRPALERFGVPVAGRVALDCGASAGGFVQALLEAGAARVYAVDVGFGQLLGSLRQDPRVVNLERTNLGELDAARVGEPVDVVTLDVGFLALADAVPQLERIALAPGAHLVGLVKPMFELRLADPPADRPALDRALAVARDGVEAAGWKVLDAMDAPVGGAGGARELFLHARRAGGGATDAPTGSVPG